MMSDKTIIGTWRKQDANTFLGGPVIGDEQLPQFRALTTADLPSGVGGGPPHNSPVLGNFSWANQGPASIVQNPDSTLFLLDPASNGGLRMQVQPAPAVPYTATLGMLPLILTDNGTVNQSTCGMCLRDSISGNSIAFGPINNAGGSAFALVAATYTSGITYVANYARALNSPVNMGFTWLRIKDDGALRYFQISADGYNFVTMFSVSRTDFITPDQFGFFAFAGQVTQDCGITVASWAVTLP
jgi:hypothetical protein